MVLLMAAEIESELIFQRAKEALARWKAAVCIFWIWSDSLPVCWHDSQSRCWKTRV